MKNYVILTLIVVILVCCEDNKNVNADNKNSKLRTDTTKSSDSTFRRFWFTKESPNDIKENVQIYLNGTDTLFNQIQFFKNGNLDYSKSFFYELELVNSKNDSEYNGTLIYHSAYDKIIESPLIEKSLDLTIVQFTKDSAYGERFSIKTGNEIKFKLKNYKNNQLIGILNELRLIDTVIDGEKRIRVIESTMYVDNKDRTDNKLIKWN